MTRAEIAKSLFMQGYTCSQAVALAFADLCKIDTEELKNLMLPFGGGIARLRLTCGAVSGMVAISGLLFADKVENKAKMYELTRELCEKFQVKNGSLICAELLKGANVNASSGGAPEERTEQYYKKRPCHELVYDAAEILEIYLSENPI
ncbi:MAG: C_GCAxxG_C_C family protein [Clostridia bacterium]|nr:C_GCAxxG_C_C family protein [Clostridia bacterium]